MRRLVPPVIVSCLALLAFAPSAHAAFGFEALDVEFLNSDGSPATQAGSHPFEMKTTLDVNVDPGTGQPEGAVKDLIVDLPAGLVGDPMAVPRCSAVDFLTLKGAEGDPLQGIPSCPDSTAVGYIAARAPNETVAGDFGAAFNLIPPPGVAATIGFRVLNVFITIDVGVRPEGEHNVFSSLRNIPQVEPFVGSELVLWGDPFDPDHNAERGGCLMTPEADLCPPDDSEPRAFLTLPRRCDTPLLTIFEMDSWQNPGDWVRGEVESHDDSIPAQPIALTGCEELGFDPTISSQPTTEQVESPTGLDFDLQIDDEGLTDPEGLAHSDIEEAVVTLPKGVTANPSLAEGLDTCSPEDLERETIDSFPGEGCPQASKIGTVEVETPLLREELLEGQVYVATPDDPVTPTAGAENPFDSLLALYVVIKHPELGILVKQAGEVAPNPTTGQLTTTFEDIPQVPFSDFRFHFREGGRSPLITPPTCGTHTTEAIFTPRANPSESLKVTSSFEVTKGVGGGPCPPAGPPPFLPAFTAGTVDNDAGSHSPFQMRIARRDGDQDITRFSAKLPPGLLAKLAGVSKCPEEAIAAAKTKTGRAELASPSCPANSQIGRTLAGAGVGSQLTYVSGKLYLAGPFAGAPLSVLAVVPAVAGPFDVGTVVVREALTLDRSTAEVRADGTKSDPIPHILAGIPLKVRDLRVYVDRPNFVLNPTNCNPAMVDAQLWGGGSDPFNVADDLPLSLSAYFQADNCLNLGFKPKLNLALKGSTKRGGHPALKAIVRPRPGDANFKRAVVTLPRSAFLDQAHIRTICTRVQFAQSACPAGSIYGKARAVTPLLDEALEGPVYLRSSNNKLPDLVAVLKGIVEVELVGRIDSHKGGIRSTFEAIPDAPVSSFTLEMQGGKKGLIVNSRDLCAARSKAKARLMGQNGRRHEFGAVVRAVGCRGKRK